MAVLALASRLSFLLLSSLLGGVLVVLSGCSFSPSRPVSLSEATVSHSGVIVTTEPVALLFKEIGQGRTTVQTLVPAGREPHGFEPDPRSLGDFSTAMLAAWQGVALDAWAASAVAERTTRKLPTFRLADGVELLEGNDTETDEHADSPERAGAFLADPHFWLDPVIMKNAIARVQVAMTQADPTGSGQYAINAQTLQSRMGTLDAEWKQWLSHCARSELPVSHDALRYLSKRYGFTTVAIAGLSPEDEPSPQKIANLATQARAKGWTHIVAESGESLAFTRTLAAEANLQVLPFDTLELPLAPNAMGNNYVSRMRQNLVSVKTALGCQ